MIRFKYRYCKVHMARFISGELSEAARRRVGRYIDECEDCQREYLRHREFAQKLERNLPALGRPSPQRLDELWTSLRTELQTPAKPTLRFSDFASPQSMQFSYGLVMLAVSIALLLPMMIGFHASQSPIDLPRLPQSSIIASTQNAHQAGRPFLVATAEPGARGRAPMLHNTPAQASDRFTRARPEVT
ncbi:MAG: hypothetical protein OXG68_05180 [Chloroflexi bacterium]|nr:hypothetical protein [Chloroflexota bacterium]